MSLRRSAGFTLVEMMIVIAILGMLAAVAIPQFLSNKQEGKSAAMVSSLSVLRTAIDSYWSQHDTFPGQKDAKEFGEQLLQKTDKAGKVVAADKDGYGPYIRNGVLPTNPLTDTNTVKVVDTMPAKPSGTEGWIYSKKTGEIRANFDGKTADGVTYFSL
ncbi:MAG: type II secretion system protein [Planctomycetota bacterium]